MKQSQTFVAECDEESGLWLYCSNAVEEDISIGELLIDAKTKQSVADTVKYAEENKISRFDLLSRMNAGGPSVGDDEGRCCYFYAGFKVVYSIEEQPRGWSRHISVSVASQDKMPNIVAVEMIMKEFGFDKELKDCYVYIEDSFPKSINIISE